MSAITAEEMRELVARALAEDLGGGDVTGEATVPAQRMASARIVQKAPGVVFGLDLVIEVMAQTGVEEVDTRSPEGEWCQDVPAEVLVARGSARAILAAERTALNFLGHLSGVATLTARYVEAVAGTRARILDTRKTTPGLRRLEKAAVAAGGGTNHRMGLFDAFLVKENHIAAAGGISKAVFAARKAHPELPIEVEVDNLDDVAYALGTGADQLLLDNMDAPTMRAAVEAPRRPLPGRWQADPGGLRQRQPADGPRGRRDRRRFHLGRRPDPLGPSSRLLPPAQHRLTHVFVTSAVRRGGGWRGSGRRGWPRWVLGVSDTALAGCGRVRDAQDVWGFREEVTGRARSRTSVGGSRGRCHTWAESVTKMPGTSRFLASCVSSRTRDGAPETRCRL